VKNIKKNPYFLKSIIMYIYFFRYSEQARQSQS